ncbi:GlsB/YeaQ/YmgE family stress response membrane protein [Aeromicrobium chenweiae]|uniref:GlsB/YeaQ/YmgE family stress response membrane protein n=1 Tax=Aeromicrobium chenweiae TaxID=2079793 RepID=A0A2S0WMZ9_9ACTN|nr:GlsB/YeaQ/YmgE family stress response membrane protein [Aeromicrobium chenweiae]AWB92687.1 GlsB/YeaQ/YmgE family stress response membrane protein [Aeromicrobium chenweiae]TGN33678.1 GlsB/YeaQ/YmgE family stress response membrane protein [Aeromicrobium chenweiae]
MGIIGFIIVGLIAGFIARAVVPGKDDFGIIGTIVLGMVGSLVGGFLGSLLSDGPTDLTAAGIIGSIIGAIIALVAYNAITGRKKA